MLTAKDTQCLHRLVKQITAKKLTQTEISRATGVHQSQVSRILAGQFTRASRNVQRLCEYAKYLPEAEPDRPTDEIVGAVRVFLGGVVTEERALADLLRSLRAWRQRWMGNP